MDVLLRTRVPPEMVPVFLIILIPWLIWLTVKQVLFLRRIRSCTELIPGEVTSLTETGRTRYHGSKFSPNIKYTYIGRDGEEHTDFFEAEHSYSYDEYYIGMTVHLFIDPADGTNVYLAGEKQDALQAILVNAVLLLVLILCAVLMLR